MARQKSHPRKSLCRNTERFLMAAVDPMHISPFFNVPDAQPRKKVKDERTSARNKSAGSVFGTLLKETEKEAALETEFETESEVRENQNVRGKEGLSFDERLTELVDAVYAAGDELKKNPFTDTFIRYKKQLSRFMHFVVQNAYELEVRERRKGTKRQQLVTVQTINAKLDELAADILYNQADQLKILAKIEEINGLLVDFLS